MQFLVFLSTFSIPLILFIIIGYAVLKKQDVYHDFVSGAMDGLHTVLKIMPTLIGLMVAVGVLRASGFLDMVSELFGRVLSGTGLPQELIPVTIVRMFSSSAATGLVLDIFKEHGPDSYIGRIASIMMSCTETIFYTMSVYFMAAKVTKTRWTLAGALVSTAVGVAASVVLAGWM